MKNVRLIRGGSALNRINMSSEDAGYKTDKKMAITVLSGFLGAGKTTFILARKQNLYQTHQLSHLASLASYGTAPPSSEMQQSRETTLIPLAKCSMSLGGRTSLSKIASGIARVATALGTSTIPEILPSHGQQLNNR
jgi:hypothetical protein